jgi:hypothetical protein
MQVTSCYNLLVAISQLSFISSSARMNFLEVQHVFIVKQYLAFHSYLTYQIEFRDTFSDSAVPSILALSGLVNGY